MRIMSVMRCAAVLRVGACLACLAAAVAVAGEEAERPRCSLSLDLASKYVTRGLMVNEDPVLQPEVGLSWHGFKASFWGNYDFTDYNRRDNEFEELDWQLSYERTFCDLVTVEGGVIWYKYPGSGDDSKEVFVLATFDNWLLTPGIGVYYDFDEANGVYVNPTVEHTFELCGPLSLTFSGGIGWGNRNFNEYNMGLYENGFTDATAELYLEYQPMDWLGTGPFVAWTQVLDHELEDSLEADPDYHSSQCWFGWRLTAEF